jgi:hypothetical protein
VLKFVATCNTLFTFKCLSLFIHGPHQHTSNLNLKQQIQPSPPHSSNHGRLSHSSSCRLRHPIMAYFCISEINPRRPLSYAGALQEHNLSKAKSLQVLLSSPQVSYLCASTFQILAISTFRSSLSNQAKHIFSHETSKPTTGAMIPSTQTEAVSSGAQYASTSTPTLCSQVNR